MQSASAREAMMQAHVTAGSQLDTMRLSRQIPVAQPYQTKYGNETSLGSGA